MKPPICELCGEDFRHEWNGEEAGGGLVQFADYRPLPSGRMGHPEGLAFFCSRHLIEARSLHTLTLSEALQRMQN
ncbi:MAG: hypothetical protein KDK37_02990 [Leptospiraceae bacterium]|nr:hypothetical protein [Leptospiraceae bacterium]MCB1303209.1 hypothetical protein [Leptospiraceae bacterium]